MGLALLVVDRIIRKIVLSRTREVIKVVMMVPRGKLSRHDED